MLSPMAVQYLVALCCLKSEPSAVDLTIGDMVHDAGAAKERDVDITLTTAEGPCVVSAFKAYEVKREARPLDVLAVEQLCMKLTDMPKVTHRGIVTTSGFTDAAAAKAAAHGVELFELKRMDPARYQELHAASGLGLNAFANFFSTLLFWVDYELYWIAPNGPPAFELLLDVPLLTRGGRPHRGFKTLRDFQTEVLLRSTKSLLTLEPARSLRDAPRILLPNAYGTVGTQPQPHTHTLDVAGDSVFVTFGSGVAQLTTVTISGKLQWQTSRRLQEFHVVERLHDATCLAGAAVADLGSRDGRLAAFVFAPGSRAVGVHFIELSPKHRNAIRKLKLLHDGSPSGAN